MKKVVFGILIIIILIPVAGINYYLDSKKRPNTKWCLKSEALERAEEECAADEEARQVARVRAAARRAELDQEYVGRFAVRVREVYAYCPKSRSEIIVEHTCRKYSGRV